jgi:membrane-associated phospholipid phosphatase
MAEVVAINEVNNSNTIMIINTLLLVLMGLVCFARIYLKAHTFLQVIAGLSLGFSLMFVVVYFQWSI